MKVETKWKENNRIVAEVCEDDNTMDIAVVINDDPIITLNIAVDKDKVTIRKWVGFGDSEDETIYIDDLYEEQD